LIFFFVATELLTLFILPLKLTH